MTKEQLQAINNYCVARFNRTDVYVYKVVNVMVSDANRINCTIDDIINAFINYDIFTLSNYGYDVVVNIVNQYLSTKYKHNIK